MKDPNGLSQKELEEIALDLVNLNKEVTENINNATFMAKFNQYMKLCDFLNDVYLKGYYKAINEKIQEISKN
jgi:hypothetical protein